MYKEICSDLHEMFVGSSSSSASSTAGENENAKPFNMNLVGPTQAAGNNLCYLTY